MSKISLEVYLSLKGALYKRDRSELKKFNLTRALSKAQSKKKPKAKARRTTAVRL